MKIHEKNLQTQRISIVAQNAFRPTTTNMANTERK